MRLLFRLGHTHVLQIAEVFRSGLIAFLLGDIGVQVHHLDRRFEIGPQRHIGVAVFGAPDDGFRADQPRNPLLRHRLLNRQLPGIDVPVMVVFALVAPRSRFGPRLLNKVMGFVKALPIVGRVDIIGELFRTRTTHPAGYQAAAGNHIKRGQLFGQSQRVAHREGVAE